MKIQACRFQLHYPQPVLKHPATTPPIPKDGGLLFRQKLLYLQSLERSLSSFPRTLPLFLPLPFPHLPLSLTRCPRLLVSSVPTQLRPTLRFLTSVGLVLNSHTTLLLVSDVENTLKPKINFLQSLGFDEPEVNRMVVAYALICQLEEFSLLEMLECSAMMILRLEGLQGSNDLPVVVTLQWKINVHSLVVPSPLGLVLAELSTLAPCHMMVAMSLTQGISES
ncbi:hypothetical protein Gotur_007398 [Gossypium turneri]